MEVRRLKHCQYAFDEDGRVWLAIDVAGSPANALSLAVVEDLHTALDEIEAAGGRPPLALRSGHARSFMTGLDADTLERLGDAEYAREVVDRGQALTERIAQWPAPTVAVIQGSCLGGGLEVALAARYRVAASSQSTLIGLPEIHLGMHCHFGGSARLADLIGMTPALDFIIAARTLGVVQAERIGLVDRAVPAEVLDDVAVDLIERDPGARRPRGIQRLLSLKPVRFVRELIRIADDEEPVAPESHPATLALRALWRSHGSESTARRIAAERESFLALMERGATRNFQRVFLVQERLRREGRAAAEIDADHVHVVGAGTIGAEVATLLALEGRAVTLADRDRDAAAAGQARVHARLRQELGAGPALEAAEALVTTVAGHADAAGADLAIEAVEEDRAAKRAVHAELEAELSPGAVIATATSTFTVDSLAAEMTHPQRLIGLHFQPAITSRSLSGLVEVIGGARSSAASVARGRALVVLMQRTPLVVADRPAFLVNRLLLPYIIEGARRYSRPRREVIDAAARYVGMTVGPLELADWYGLQYCRDLIEALAEARSLEMPRPLIEQIEAGRFGRSVRKGFHDWRGYQRVVAALPPNPPGFRELGGELVEPILAEAERCRAEGIVASDDELDAGAVLGAGFPAYTGGPLTWRRNAVEAPPITQPASPLAGLRERLVRGATSGRG